MHLLLLLMGFTEPELLLLLTVVEQPALCGHDHAARHARASAAETRYSLAAVLRRRPPWPGLEGVLQPRLPRPATASQLFCFAQATPLAWPGRRATASATETCYSLAAALHRRPWKACRVYRLRLQAEKAVSIFSN